MGIRIRKRIKLAPGVHMNLGSKSGSVSVGGKGVYLNTKLYGKKKKSGSGSGQGGRLLGKVCFWMFVGWWWWPIRLVCYDLPKLIVKKIKEAQENKNA